MRKAPNIGDRVQLKFGHRYYPCTGTVTAIYPTYVWDEENERSTNTPRPQSEWHVGVRVDSLPANWAYRGTDRFAPAVGELDKIR